MVFSAISGILHQICDAVKRLWNLSLFIIGLAEGLIPTYGFKKITPSATSNSENLASIQIDDETSDDDDILFDPEHPVYYKEWSWGQN